MKVSPDLLVLESFTLSENNNFFLITGNEETYIQKILEIIINQLKKFNYNEVERYENLLDSEKVLEGGNVSLFYDKKIIVLKNPKKLEFEKIKNIKIKDRAVIIIDTKIKNTSKIKKYFDAEKEKISITCYKLSKDNKKRIIDHVFKKNSIKIENDGYWFFLDRSDDRYMLFENEINKIIIFDKKNISLKDINLLMAHNLNSNIDGLFFLILSPPKEIINKTQINIGSSSDCYMLLQRTKYYLDICIRSKDLGEAREFFPKYLFMEKEKFLTIYKKLSSVKKSRALQLVKKSEIMIRKHNDMHLLIIQRFLLNLKKTIG